ncbi:nucleoside deaminase [Haliea sp. E17]|uniref:nucleoside deaminase n=1 Tax=Haliea sp. E17 TaxID=3401576 RepID=UPI003AB0ADA0
MVADRRSFIRNTVLLGPLLIAPGALFSRAVAGEKFMPDLPQPPGSDPTAQQIIANLRRANEVARGAMVKGHHPFGAVLVAADHETVLMEQGNINAVNHAESTLARLAAEKYRPEELWAMTLYSTAEPCAMCAGTQYWANIGRLVFGISEARLLELTGSSEENPTMDVPSRYVFQHSQKAIRVWGPVPEVEEEIVALHRDFWS